MAEQMSSKQLIAALSTATGADRKTTTAMLEALTKIVTESVAAGTAVTIPGIGKVSSRDRDARQVRNPATGEMIQKEADKVIRITAAKSLRTSINP